MKPDITCRADIEKFIVDFYQKVRADETIGFIFNDVVQMNWEKHIPLIVDFWETILLDNPVYKKNAMEVHFDLNKKIPLQKEHFTSWLLLFGQPLMNYLKVKLQSWQKQGQNQSSGFLKAVSCFLRRIIC